MWNLRAGRIWSPDAILTFIYFTWVISTYPSPRVGRALSTQLCPSCIPGAPPKIMKPRTTETGLIVTVKRKLCFTTEKSKRVKTWQVFTVRKTKRDYRKG